MHTTAPQTLALESFETIRIMKSPAFPNSVRRLVAPLVLAALLPAALGRAQSVSPYMVYQGYLTDGNGRALGGTGAAPGSYDVVFRIFNAPAGGTEFYAEEQPVMVTKGYFSVLLGQGIVSVRNGVAEVHPPLATVFTNAGLYIELTVQGAGAGNGTSLTLSPRLPLASTPYAFEAQHAVNAGQAAFAYNLGSGANPQLVNLTNNEVNIGGPLVVAGTMTASNLTVGPAGSTLNNASITGGASVAALNVAGLAGINLLTVTNGVSAASASAASTLNAASLNVAGAVSVSSARANSVFAGTASAPSVAGSSLTAGSVSASGLAQVSGAFTVNAANYRLPAVGTTEGSLRILRGAVNSSGTISNNGNTSTAKAVANRIYGSSRWEYDIAFNRAYSGTPVVMVTPVSPSAPLDNDSVTYFTPVLLSVTPTGFAVEFVNWDFDNNPNPQGFDFIAIGPP